MNEQSCQASQLVLWYREYLEHGKSAAFVSSVSVRYSVVTMQRMTTAADHEVRRAAVLALGMLGGGESIAAVGECLRDPDRCVRLVAEIAFADLTRRQLGMGPCQQLDIARRHMDGYRYQKASSLLEELTETWPEYTDAWHLRSVIYFCAGKYQSAMRTARKAVQLNEYYFAAYALQARCYLELDQPDHALPYFKKSLAVNPSQSSICSFVEVLSRRAPP